MLLNRLYAIINFLRYLRLITTRHIVDMPRRSYCWCNTSYSCDLHCFICFLQQELGDRGTQSVAEAMDQHGNLYFGLVEPPAIACWNIETPYDREHIVIVSHNEKTLQFASGVKIVKNRLGEEELWVLTCRFQKFLSGTQDHSETNFRVLAIPTNQLLNIQRRCIGATLSSRFISFT